MKLRVSFDAAIPFGDAINELLKPIITPFEATSAIVVDNAGNSTEAFSSVVYDGEREARAVPIDKVAAVIDSYDVLTLDTLATAYQRIRAVKSARKTDRPQPFDGDTHMTTGIVVARNADVTLDQISSEMDRLNGSIPSHCWPDAVAVLSAGLVNYSAHMPASEKSGDFFLPAETIAARSPSPSLWVQKVIRPMGDLTFSKVASLIVGRIKIFRPSAEFSAIVS